MQLALLTCCFEAHWSESRGGGFMHRGRSCIWECITKNLHAHSRGIGRLRWKWRAALGGASHHQGVHQIQFKYRMGVGFRVHASHSHYSYHASNGSYLLCDLQGSYSDNKFVLTDPVIHSRAGEFGATDGGEEAISYISRRCWQVPAIRRHGSGVA